VIKAACVSVGSLFWFEVCGEPGTPDKIQDQTWSDADATAISARRVEIEDALGEGSFDELLETFFEDAAALLTEMRTLLVADSAAPIDNLLHTLRGSAANLGLSGIANIAQSLSRDPAPQTGVVCLEQKMKTYRDLTQQGRI
jgi:hypothetical protein